MIPAALALATMFFRIARTPQPDNDDNS